MSNAKGRKQVRRKIRYSGVIFMVFIASFVAFLASSIFLKSFNVSLDLARQNYRDEIIATRASNETLQYEVKELSNYDRIMNIVDKDMVANDNAVFTVPE